MKKLRDHGGELKVVNAGGVFGGKPKGVNIASESTVSDNHVVFYEYALEEYVCEIP